MSTAPLGVPHTPSLRRANESYGEKAWRKFKDEPLVPLGALATVGAFTMAAIKLRRRESRSLNYWMRMRVAAQALTIAAVCYYYWHTQKDGESTQPRQLEELQAKRDQHLDKERKEFEGRLKAAEVQWKESEGSDQNTVVAKGDAAAPATAKIDPQASPSTSSSSWWKMVWLWGGSSSPRSQDNQKESNKPNDEKKPS